MRAQNSNDSTTENRACLTFNSCEGDHSATFSSAVLFLEGEVMKRTISLVFVFALWVQLAAAQTKSAKTLDIYVVDVEGGNAVLFVPPSGQSVLIDTGNGGPGAVRDAERVAAAIHDAGVKQIDHLIITHFHN